MINICVLGNFSGSKTANDNNKPTLYKLDIDNLNKVMQKINPTAEIALPNNKSITLSFGELDDFHPDNLFKKIDFDKYAEELYRIAENKLKNKPVSKNIKTLTNDENSNGILDSLMLGEITETAEPRHRIRREDAISKLLQKAVDSSIIYKDIKGEETQENKEKLFSIIMRHIIHSPEFKSLESIWMSIDFLLTNISLDEEDFNLYIADVSNHTFYNDICRTEGVSESLIYKSLADKFSSLTGEYWDLMVGDYSFGIDYSSNIVLKKIAELTRLLDVPFIAAGKLSGPLHFDKEPEFRQLVKNPDSHFSEWNTLRTMKGTENIGLAFPRFILRYPYSNRDNPIDSFEFKELEFEFTHQDFLWGNSAFLCCTILASAEIRCNWKKMQNISIKISDLPMISIQLHEDKIIIPCAEVLLPDRKIEEIKTLGFLPIISIKHENAAYVKFKSLKQSK